MFHFAPAVREQVSILIALAGASGSGKTMSALRLARGMGKKTVMVDTEARRGLHYADDFDFLHYDMQPPFHPQRFIDIIQAATEQGAEVIVIDSFSHEYDGPGGITEWAAALEEKGVKGPGAWKEPKLAHKRMMQTLLQCRAHLIFCLRADEKIEMKKQDGKTVVIPIGWTPICEKRFMFEMTASFTLVPNDPGRPHYELAHKIQAQHRPMFPAGELISEQSGSLLAAWARGGKPTAKGGPPNAVEVAASTSPGSDAAAILAIAREAAERGTEFFNNLFWPHRSAAEKKIIRGIKPELIQLMEQHDAGEIAGQQRSERNADTTDTKPADTGTAAHE